MGMYDYATALQRIVLTFIINTVNLLAYILSYGTITTAEGRFYSFSDTWANWNLYFVVTPKTYYKPSSLTSEDEICEVVKAAGKVRVVGAGHSFNPANLCEDLLINLDDYKRILHFDTDRGIITVQAGIRLYEFFRETEAKGWDIPVMGTANHQSIGALVATDLHSTGRKSGFLSQQLLSLRIVNSKGIAETFDETSDVFLGAVGGIGAMGVVTEVTIQLVPTFLLKRTITYVNRTEVEASVDKLVQKHEHFGLFYLGGIGATKVRMAVYDHAEPYESISHFAYFRDYIQQISDMLSGGYIMELCNWFPWVLDLAAFMWNHSPLSLPLINTPGAAFTASVFFRHDEMEYAMPYENYHKAISEILDFLDRVGWVAPLEVRFTVNNAKPKTLLGPAQGRESVFIEILPTLVHDTRKIYANTEHFFEQNDGRPHLGKYTTYQQPDMVKHFGPELVKRWLTAREKQDPDQKFVNGFVHQVFLNQKPSSPSTPFY